MMTVKNHQHIIFNSKRALPHRRHLDPDLSQPLAHDLRLVKKKNFGFPTRVVAVAVAVVAVETVGLGGVVAAVRVGVVVGLKINEELGKNSATSKCVFS